VGDITSRTDWGAALDGVDTVIHAAATAHRLNDAAAEEPYLEVNARGTLCLARAAARARVTRFIYLSSIKVNGEGKPDRPYSASDEPRPCDAYARSKWLAEGYLQDVVEATAMQGVVVRAPLVYGPEVKGNFLRLLRWVQTGRPVPLGGIDNARSLVSIWNLCDLLRLLMEHPAAPGRTWMVSDGEDLSTPELVRRIARAMGRRARLLAVPSTLLAVAARLSGRSTEFARLCGSLTVDVAATRLELGWSPRVSVTEGIARTVDWYLTKEHARGT
jgi:UDP-glucose 4-epimerase